MNSREVSPGRAALPRRVTQSAYRAATSATVTACQAGASDQDMADRWGVSASTVKAARNRDNDLSAVPLLNLGSTFGCEALNTIAALIGAQFVPIEAITLTPEDVAAIPCNVAATVPALIRLLADGDCSDADVRQLDKEGAIDCLIRVADMLEQRRNDLRLRVVA